MLSGVERVVGILRDVFTALRKRAWDLVYRSALELQSFLCLVTDQIIESDKETQLYTSVHTLKQ